MQRALKRLVSAVEVGEEDPGSGLRGGGEMDLHVGLTFTRQQSTTPDSGLPMPNFKKPNLNPSGDTPPRQISSQGNSDNVTGSDIILASRSTVH